MGVESVVLTADEVLHDGDVVSHSDRFETTTTTTPVSCTVSIDFLDELVKAGSGLPILWEFVPSSNAMGSTTFHVAMLL